MLLNEINPLGVHQGREFWEVTYETTDGREMSRILPSESEEKVRKFVEKFLGRVISVEKVDKPKMKAADALAMGKMPKIPPRDGEKIKASVYFDMLRKQKEAGGRLDESVTFSVAKIKKHEGRDMYDTTEFAKEAHIECRDCDGKGKYENGHECHYCKGSGKERTWEYDYEHLNVSNDNAAVIVKMLGVVRGDEWSGAWKHEELPAIKRKLIKLKNGDTSGWTEGPSDEQGPTRAFRDENGMSRIGRGPRMISGGRSQAQIDRYVDALMDIVDFAQKHGAAVCWS